jgi:hypothetical protein
MKHLPNEVKSKLSFIKHLWVVMMTVLRHEPQNRRNFTGRQINELKKQRTPSFRSKLYQL